MRLYQVLMSYHHDDMDETDDYIHMQMPQLERKITDRNIWNRNTKTYKIVWKSETIYTRLRNEVGHNRPHLFPLRRKCKIIWAG